MSINFCLPRRAAMAVLLVVIAGPVPASGHSGHSPKTDSANSSNATDPELVFQLSSGFGLSPANIGSSLWAIEAMAGKPIFNGDFIWLGSAPTIVPKFHLEENVGDGFIPISVEYDHPVSRSVEERLFLYGMFSVGPQFGDHSDRAFVHTWMASAGIGMKDGGVSGFIGKFGLDYTSLRTGSAGLFVVLVSGIYF